MNQKTVGLTLRALVIALALILAASPGLPLLDGVAYAQGAAPTLTAVVAPGGASVSVSWTAVTGADSYELYKQQEGGSWSAAMDMTGTTYSDTSVSAGASYFYIVRAVTGGTAGAWSNTPKVTIPGGTSAPTGKPTLTATADGLNGVDLSWTAVTGATSYDLRRWNGTTSAWDSIGNNPTGTSYDDDGLDSGETYYYVIRAVNAGGNGPWSSADGVGYSSVTLTATTTVPVLSLTHTSRTVVDLSWTPVAAGATYAVERMKVNTNDGTAASSGDGAPNYVAFATLAGAGGLTTTSFTDRTATSDATHGDTILTNDFTTYTYRVQAIVGGQHGTWSNTKSAVVPLSGARPPTPADPSATVTGSTSISVGWTASAGATGYEIQFKVGDGNYSTSLITVAGQATVSHDHTGLRPETKYTYQVRAVNVNGPSDWSSEASTTTPASSTDAGQLRVPSLTAVDDTDTTDATNPIAVELRWSGVSGADDYQILRWLGTSWSAALTLSDDDKTKKTHRDFSNTIAAGTTYYYVIRAVDTNGNDVAADDDYSDWSAPVPVTTKAAAPTIDAANAAVTPIVRGPSSIWLSWTGFTGATSYDLEWRYDSSTSPWNRINVEGRTSYSHTNLRPDTTYFYRVRGKNSGGMTSYSAESAPAKTWAGRLATPTGLTVADDTTGGTAAIELTWNAVSGATTYELQRWTGTAWGSLAGTANEVTSVTADLTKTQQTTDDAGASTAGTTYYYIVRAVSGQVTSDWSSPASGATKHTTPTAAPTLIVTPVGETMVRVTWSEQANATSYVLEWIEGDLDAFTQHTKQTPVTLNAMPRYYLHRNLMPGKKYSYRIKSVLPQDVESPFSTTVVQTYTRPLRPQLTANAESDTEIKLSWNASMLAGADGASARLADAGNYEVQRRDASSGDWTDVDISAGIDCASDPCEFTDSGLTANTQYYYRIRVETTTTDPAITDLTSYWDYANQRTMADSN